MLRIFDRALEMTPEMERLMDQIGEHNRDLKRQLKKSWPSVVLNIAEGGAARGGNRRLKYEIALTEARESKAVLQYALRARYIKGVSEHLREGFCAIIGTLVKNVVRGS